MTQQTPIVRKSSIIAITSLRNATNTALANGDLKGYRDLMAEDYIVLPGSHGLPINKDAISAALDRHIVGDEFLSIIRMPKRIHISFNGQRAAEQGNWVTEWRKPDGVMRVEGIYQATWIGADEHWQLLNESFVTLACSGSSDCVFVK